MQQTTSGLIRTQCTPLESRQDFDSADGNEAMRESLENEFQESRLRVGCDIKPSDGIKNLGITTTLKRWQTHWIDLRKCVIPYSFEH